MPIMLISPPKRAIQPDSQGVNILYSILLQHVRLARPNMNHLALKPHLLLHAGFNRRFHNVPTSPSSLCCAPKIEEHLPQRAGSGGVPHPLLPPNPQHNQTRNIASPKPHKAHSGRNHFGGQPCFVAIYYNKVNMLQQLFDYLRSSPWGLMIRKSEI